MGKKLQHNCSHTTNIHPPVDKAICGRVILSSYTDKSNDLCGKFPTSLGQRITIKLIFKKVWFETNMSANFP